MKPTTIASALGITFIALTGCSVATEDAAAPDEALAPADEYDPELGAAVPEELQGAVDDALAEEATTSATVNIGCRKGSPKYCRNLHAAYKNSCQSGRFDERNPRYVAWEAACANFSAALVTPAKCKAVAAALNDSAECWVGRSLYTKYCVDLSDGKSAKEADATHKPPKAKASKSFRDCTRAHKLCGGKVPGATEAAQAKRVLRTWQASIDACIRPT